MESKKVTCVSLQRAAGKINVCEGDKVTAEEKVSDKVSESLV